MPFYRAVIEKELFIEAKSAEEALHKAKECDLKDCWAVIVEEPLSPPLPKWAKDTHREQAEALFEIFEQQPEFTLRCKLVC